MQIAVDISLPNILQLISKMNLDEIEEVKNTIVKREIYFKKFKKDDIQNIMNDFKEKDYSTDFLAELESGLKKSSIYEN